MMNDGTPREITLTQGMKRWPRSTWSLAVFGLLFIVLPALGLQTTLSGSSLMPAEAIAINHYASTEADDSVDSMFRVGSPGNWRRVHFVTNAAARITNFTVEPDPDNR
jgi:hypothetical protein